MQEIIRVDNQPAEVFVNFDEVKAKLQQHLQHYEKHVVTADTVADARKLAAELNALGAEINKRRKDEIDRASVHIRQFEAQMKELVDLTKEARATITGQIERFDNETKAKVQALLEARRAELWDEFEVDDEFKSAEFDDLVKLTSITKRGRLAKTAASELENRVRADAAKQHKIELRLANLSAASTHAGLVAPLTRDHVAHFLFTDSDDDYEIQLQRILDAEVERQAKAEQRAREKAERDADQQRKAELREAERQRRLEDAAAAQKATPQEQAAEPVVRSTHAQPDADGKVTYVVIATFEIRVAPHTTIDEIREGANEVLKGAGIKTLRTVTAHRKSAAA